MTRRVDDSVGVATTESGSETTVEDHGEVGACMLDHGGGDVVIYMAFLGWPGVSRGTSTRRASADCWPPQGAGGSC